VPSLRLAPPQLRLRDPEAARGPGIREGPDDLGSDGTALWDEIAGNEIYVFRPDEYRLLVLASRQLDVITQLRAAFAENPDYIVKGSTGQPVVNPLIAEIRQASAAFASLMRQLGIPHDEERARQREEKITQEMRVPAKRSVKVRKGA
jgi:hypothetical protein